MNVLVRHWRQDGIRMIAYLDDWLFLTKRVDATRLRDRVPSDCVRAHVAINREKSTAHPLRSSHTWVSNSISRMTFSLRSNPVGIAYKRISGPPATAVGRPLDSCQR